MSRRRRTILARQTGAPRAVGWHERQAARVANHAHARWHMDAAVDILRDAWRSEVGPHEIARIASWHEKRAEHYVHLNLLAQWHMDCARQLRQLADQPVQIAA
jgi:hypothetical protein